MNITKTCSVEVDEAMLAAYKQMIGQLINANAALMAAGEKMEAALNQCNVRPHVLQEWRAVIRQIKRT